MKSPLSSSDTFCQDLHLTGLGDAWAVVEGKSRASLGLVKVI